MPRLLNDEFAPLTFQMGFLETKFERLATTYEEWRKRLGLSFASSRESLDLSAAISKLQPLTTPPCRDLFISTSGDWIAHFDNGLRLSGPESLVGHLCTLLSCRGVVIHCVPDRSSVADRRAIRRYGVASFTLYSPKPTDWLNVERHVSVTNDGGKWVFSERGVARSFERVDRYKQGKLADRLTEEMISDYCQALGIRPFDASFYGGPSLLSIISGQLTPTSPSMQLEEAKRLSLMR